MTYAADLLMDEVAYVSASYHWPLETVLDLEHPDRQYFMAAFARLTEVTEQ